MACSCIEHGVTTIQKYLLTFCSGCILCVSRTNQTKTADQIMQKFIVAAAIALASISAHAQLSGLCALTKSCGAQAIADQQRQMVAQQKIDDQQARQEALQRSIADDQAAHNSPQQQAMRENAQAQIADARGPVECDGPMFHTYWSSARSEKLEAEQVMQRADDPRFANDSALQSQARKQADQAMKDYGRLKAKAMAACHS